MCGFLGIRHSDNKPIDLRVLVRSLNRIRYRGPDDEGYLLADISAATAVSLAGDDTEPSLKLPSIDSFSGKQFDMAWGFRRLSILDPSPAGHQPMSTPDGRYHIVFNGEIYNYLELRAEMEDMGYRFRSRSDTEVLLAACACWGKAALNRLVGMFAFCLLDMKKRSLLLARDFFGIKPLYYTFWEGGFAFASEIKALVELPHVRRAINPGPLYDYIRFGITDYGGETMLEGIRQVPAAHYIEISPDRPDNIKPVRYWRVNTDQTAEISFETAAGRMRELFMENVGLHLRSDVSVGAAMSGGIDSSAIVMAMRRLQGNSLDLHTFSYIAEDSAVSEEKWVDLVAGASGATVHKVRPAPAELVDDLDCLISMQDQPFSSTSMYAQYRVFRLAHEAGIKVMLDGQGADELLSGYIYFAGARITSLVRQGRWFQAARLLRQSMRMPGPEGGMRVLWYTGAFLLPHSLQGPARRIIREDAIPPWLNGQWFARRGVAPRSPFESRSREALRERLRFAIEENNLPKLLRFEDRNSMAFSIESRVPFLTPAFADFAMSLPEEYHIAPDGTRKSVFREAMRGIVPEAVLERKDKIGFNTPERSWMSALQRWLESVFNNETAARISAFNLPALKKEYESVLAGRRRFDRRVWRWVNLIRWVENFDVTFGE
ncbi:MAG: asparagine synthase (glutamine-hydrolyzing) [Planctomycetota bacterium]|nr:asparagine synthase (glutamine-hydrolyzing) [Planctomycetota bacterium]